MSVVWDLTAENLRAARFRPIHAGDDYNLGVTAKRDGQIIDLTAGKVWLTVKDDPIQADDEAQLQMDSDTPADIEIDSPLSGHFIVHFHGVLSPNTADLEGMWQYDIQVKEASGAITTVGGGKIEFLPNLTRSTT